ncbi:uncharacterized protein LOC133798572 [Humulus lupulus]|uniref:uncharacterized protein LOC133798572 n=1 Tax=Humulus lupulus TaxID=3486 RepID=UPI002B409683|nr:uncharacterized protein LOC133798572 [Humulus lupulus]
MLQTTWIPPGYNKSKSHAPIVAHQVQTAENPVSTTSDATTILPQLSAVQYQQLLTLLASQQSSMASLKPSTSADNSGIILSTTQSSLMHKNTYWIVDSSATIHICSNMSYFISLFVIPSTKLVLPDNSHIIVSQCGTVILPNNLILLNVLYVPSFTYNIISVSALTSSQTVVLSFCYDSFSIQNTITKKMIGKGRSSNGLYILDIPHSISQVHSVTAEIWHSRLGHLSSKCLDLLSTTLNCNISLLHKHTPMFVPKLNKESSLFLIIISLLLIFLTFFIVMYGDHITHHLTPIIIIFSLLLMTNLDLLGFI